MRFVAIVPAVFLLSITVAFSESAFAIGQKFPDAQMISTLEAKAEQAQPKEQCYRYAELVHSLIQMAGQQLSSGDDEHASNTLKNIQSYVARIHMGVHGDAKKLKNAELLMRDTAFRLKQYLNGAPLADRPTLESTMKQLNQVQAELLMQVLRR